MYNPDIEAMPRILKDALLNTNEYELSIDSIVSYNEYDCSTETISQIEDALKYSNLPDYWIVTIINDDQFYVVFESLLNCTEEDIFFKALSSFIYFNKDESLSDEFGIYSILS